MAIFRRKNNLPEDLAEESKKKVSDKFPKAKSFKDLKSENRKKRKEPPKPWGKTERTFVLFVLLITAGASFFLYLSARAWKLPGTSRLTLPSFSMPFWKEETLILKKSDSAGSEKNLSYADKNAGIVSGFKQEVKNLSGVYGLYIIRLKDGSSYGIYEDEVFEAASLIKLPVMAAAYMENEAGRFDLDQKYVLKNEDKIGGAGSLFGRPDGYETTYRNLLKLMGKQSDNTAFNIVRKTLGDEKINLAIKSIGMVKTNLSENETSPKDIGTFFEGLMANSFISRKDGDEILGNLTDTLYENWLVAGIPEGTRVAHKYGREVHVVNDGGIVFAKDPVVVVIMSKGVVEREADEVIPKLSKIVYEGEVD